MRGRVALLGIAVLALATPTRGGDDGVDPGSRLPAGGSASEYWDLAAEFESGHRFVARFLITNQGPGKRSAVAFGDLIEPGGRAVPFRNGRRAGRWTLGPAGRSLRIGSSRLDLSGSPHEVEVDNDKRGFKVQLQVPLDATAAHVFRDDYHLDLLHLASPVSGSVWHKGMSEPLAVAGRLTLTHTWLARAEAELALRRIDVSSLSAEPALYLVDLTSRGGKRRSWLALAEGGRIVRTEPGVEARLVARRGARKDYPVPGALDLTSPALRGTVSLGEPVLRRDPLEALPAPLRMLYFFGSRPHRVWAGAAIDVALKPAAGRAVLPLESSGIAALGFLESLR